MEFIFGFWGAASCLTLFAAGFLAGQCVQRVRNPAKARRQRVWRGEAEERGERSGISADGIVSSGGNGTSSDADISSGDEERAFRVLQSYSVEQAYGLADRDGLSGITSGGSRG